VNELLVVIIILVCWTRAFSIREMDLSGVDVFLFEKPL